MRQLHEQKLFDYGQIHAKTMLIIWLAAGNIGLWSQAFKHFKFLIYLHLSMMSIVALISWMSAFLAIMIYGLPARNHARIGIIVMILLSLAFFSGIVCFYYQKSSKTPPVFVIYINYFHRGLGYLTFISSFLQILIPRTQLNPAIFNPSIGVCIASFVLFVIVKVYRFKISTIQASKNDKLPDLPIVRSEKELARYGQDYFIYRDLIYDLTNLQSSHPGGFQIIRLIKGRQVCRYLIGSEPIDGINKNIIHCHTSNCMGLAGKPILRWQTHCPFSGMEENNQVVVKNTKSLAKNTQIYIIYLGSQVSQNSLDYEGYTLLSQLGKYYSVVINQKKQRLYTLVNFLHPRNLLLMSKIMKVQFLKQPLSMDQTLQTSISQQQLVKNKKLIPLLIKRDQKGYFTSEFLPPNNQNFQGRVGISKPRGKGLCLGEINGGKIIFFAGGTGINPFLDTIDLLYKQFLVQFENPYSRQVIKNDPIVEHNHLTKNFSFILYYSVQNANEIFELNARQIDQLCKYHKMQAYIKIPKKEIEEFKAKYPNINILSKRFQQVIDKDLNQQQISQVYICGRKKTIDSVVQSLKNKNFPKTKYRSL